MGAKIRFTGPNDALGVALIPFYRWYLDKADDFQGFNQLQRGASAGSDMGDFGLIGVVVGTPEPARERVGEPGLHPEQQSEERSDERRGVAGSAEMSS